MTAPNTIKKASVKRTHVSQAGQRPALLASHPQPVGGAVGYPLWRTTSGVASVHHFGLGRRPSEVRDGFRGKPSQIHARHGAGRPNQAEGVRPLPEGRDSSYASGLARRGHTAGFGCSIGTPLKVPLKSTSSRSTW